MEENDRRAGPGWLNMTGPACYEIKAQGVLNESWQEWFEPLQICRVSEGEQPVIILTGCLEDQAALHGTLQKLYTFGLPILSVRVFD